MLKVTTTHLKEGWLRRNGLPRSEKATLIEYFIRHDNYFTLVTDVEDPIYTTEPFIRTSNWVLDMIDRLVPYYCVPDVEVPHPKGYVAHHLPGTNRVSDGVCVPVGNTRGGIPRRGPDHLSRISAKAGGHAGASQTFRERRDETMTWNSRTFANALRVALALGALAMPPHFARAQQSDNKAGKGKVEILHVQGNVYMISGAGANITVQVGKQVVFLVDSGVAPMSNQVLAAIRSVTDKRSHVYHQHQR